LLPTNFLAVSRKLMVEKRILLLANEFPPFRGGVATYAQEVARAAAYAGHRVAVLTPGYGQSWNDHDRHRYNFEVIRFKADLYRRCKDLPGVLLQSWRSLRRRDFDIFHAVDWPFVMALAFLRKLRRFQFMATVHGTDVLYIKKTKAPKLLGVTNMFTVADRVVANSGFTKGLLLKQFPDIPETRVIVTPLGVNEFWFKDPSAETVSAVKARHSIGRDKQIILTVARLDERKGHHLVLKSLRRLATELKRGVTYLIVGEGDDPAYTARLRQLAADCGVQVVFAGAISDEELRADYACAQIFCMPGSPHPDKVEGFGLAYLEAAAMGVPAIACKIDAIPEVVRDGETGILLEPGDVPALTAALARMLREPGELRRLGSAAKAWARQFTWAKCVEKTYRGF
jgi:phosphatidylinositol alpha-1,6-mannosyltransferase